MELFAIPDVFVKKVAFIADVYERDNGCRPSDTEFICAAIDILFDVIAERIGHGVCDGGDE